MHFHAAHRLFYRADADAASAAPSLAPWRQLDGQLLLPSCREEVDDARLERLGRELWEELHVVGMDDLCDRDADLAASCERRLGARPVLTHLHEGQVPADA